MSAMLSSDATYSIEMFPFGHCPEGNGDVSSKKKTNEDRDDELDNVKTDGEQSHDEVYDCLKGGSRNSGGKRLAIFMDEEAWLSEKKEVDPLNPPPHASESEPDNEIEVENPIEHEDETVPVSVYEVGKSSTAAIPLMDGDSLLPGFMRRDIDSFLVEWSIFQDDCVDARRRVHCVEQGTVAMEKLVEKLGNTEDRVECKKLKKELEEARFSNTFLRMQNERVERDLYWTRVRAHDFYQEMIRRGFLFEERPNEAINVPIEDKKSPLSEPQ
ncbi:hypothetical protein Tco_1123172 [Tanacetum coccineum]|uniref:Uncharacterized protein n=1 Tax=Tanacetum coccineum TaxID=301880 RepID=A0ABQ5J2L8_9ASTR